MRDALTTCTLIALGGALGALSRFGVDLTARTYLPAAFPYGTLAVNVVGCFLLGFLRALETHAVSAAMQAGLATGFLGALTTFSTFGYQTFEDLEHGRPAVAVAGAAANLTLGLLAVWAGVTLARFLRGG